MASAVAAVDPSPALEAASSAAPAPAASSVNAAAPDPDAAALAAAPAPAAAAPPAEKVRLKRPKTAYFWFLEVERDVVKAAAPGIGLGDVSKAVAIKWKALTPEEQAPFLEKAKADKERYAKAKAEAIANGTFDDQSKAAGGDWSAEGTESAFPIARVRKIIKRDKEVKQISKEATNMIAKATDLFVAFLSDQTVSFTQKRRKRTVNQLDVLQAVHTGADSLDFLVEDFLTPEQLNEELAKAKKRRQASKKAEADAKTAAVQAEADGGDGAAASTGRIEAFFSVKSEGGAAGAGAGAGAGCEGVRAAAVGVEAGEQPPMEAAPPGEDAPMADGEEAPPSPAAAAAAAAPVGANPFAAFSAA